MEAKATSPPNPNLTSSLLNAAASPDAPRGAHHRRAQSEMAFRIPNDLGIVGSGGAGTGFDEDDLFCTYMDMEKIGCRLEESGSGNEGGVEDEKRGAANGNGNGSAMDLGRPRHRHCSSVDGSGMVSSMVFGEVAEAKKAMAADKLAELAAIDPKRAKRILANRQSAARSKERKARYISELERKVQTLQTEATTLSAQLTLYQRDTTGLTAENAELKLRLQAMEQQAQLRDALNEALKQEVERLKIATGEASNATDCFNFGMHNMSYNAPYFSSQQSGSLHQGMQLPQQFHQPQSSMPNHRLVSHSSPLSDMLQQDSLGRLQGLDINRGSLHMVKSESSSISASESSNTF